MASVLYTHYLSSSLHLPLRVRVGAFQVPAAAAVRQLEEHEHVSFMMQLQVFQDGCPCHPIPVETSPAPLQWASRMVLWREWHELPVQYSELDPCAILCATVVATDGTVVCGTSVRLFDDSLVMRDGMLKLRAWPRTRACGRVLSRTPGLPLPAADESFRLEKAAERCHFRRAPAEPWLDAVAADHVRATLAEAAQSPEAHDADEDCAILRRHAFFRLALPFLGHPVLFHEEPYPRPPPRAIGGNWLLTVDPWTGRHCYIHATEQRMQWSMPRELRNRAAAGGDADPDLSPWATSLIQVADPEEDAENPVDAKHFRLAKEAGALADPALKPTTVEKQQLALIMRAWRLRKDISPKDKELLWKFRYALVDDKKALIKFLYSVDWDREHEVRQALDLLHRWARIDTEDALLLLSKEFSHPAVRAYGVSVLSDAEDGELQVLLLQLVQALRYEPELQGGGRAHSPERRSPSDAAAQAFDRSASSALVVSTALASEEGAASAHGDAACGSRPAAAPPPCPYPDAATAPAHSSPRASPSSAGAEEERGRHLSPLASLLVARACHNLELATALYWYLVVETTKEGDGRLFQWALDDFHARVEAADAETGNEIHMAITKQRRLVERAYEAGQTACEGLRVARRKTERLRSLLQEGGEFHELTSLSAPVPLPLNPRIKVTGVEAGHMVRVMKSALSPFVFPFRCLGDDGPATGPEGGEEGGGEPKPAANDAAAGGDAQQSAAIKSVMFKIGDDLRQDQLIMQLIRVMDGQLKRVNLDLCLTIYDVLATSAENGLVEFVRDAMPVSGIPNSNFLAFFAKHNPSERNPAHPRPEVIDTFVRSCAGYCVVTYLLGIGDRHLDNIMLRPTGHLFHIDFGYVFGRDPKWNPPPMRLTKEMVVAMGGLESEGYRNFRSFACQAYTILRKSAGLILNLIALMLDAGIGDIGREDIEKVMNRFKLEMADEDAERVMLGDMDTSLSAIWPSIIEYGHRIAVGLK